MKYVKCKIVLLLLANWLSASSQSPGFCGTPSNIPDFLTNLSGRFQAAQNSYIIGIYLHVMRNSDGTGGQTQTEVNTAFNTLVSDYRPYNITFELLGTDEINDNTYNNQTNFTTDNNGDGKFDNFTVNSHSNAIDIYLFGNDKLNFGLASNIPGTALVIGGNAFGINLASSHVLSHEVGHCLGLFHTFHGTWIYEAFGSCPELANGSNGATCGDFVADTPADPARIFDCGSQGTCTWNCSGSYVDANGQQYNPDTHLFMAYTFPNCMNHHTQGQVSRMLSTIANSSLLSNTVIPCQTRTISNEVFSNSILITDCKINISNSSIVNNSSVVIDAIYGTTINGLFEVTLGSTLEIK